MADDPKPDEGDELDPDGDEVDSESGGSGDEPVETPEEIKAERDEYKRRLDRQRTAKAREARAAKRGGGDPKPKDDDAAAAAATALAEKDERIKELETKNNETQAINIANELGFVKPAGAVALAKLNELVDPSDPDEVRAALREVAKEYPMLKKPPAKADGGEGQGEGQGTRKSFNDMIRRAAGRG